MMNKTAMLLSVGIALFLTTQPEQPQRDKNRENHRPEIAAFDSSAMTLDLCPSGFNSAGCSAVTDKTIALNVSAIDPDGDRLTYKYSTTAGRISGKGPSVSWILDSVPSGSYTASVRVTDGRGGENRALVKVNLVFCSACDPPPPPCPTITVSCPNRASRGKLIVFSASIKGSRPYREPSYTWAISAGRIVRGQYTRHLEVDMTGFEGENITATVDVGGFDPACQRVASCSSLIKH